MTKKLLVGLCVPALVIAVLVLLRVSLSLKTIIGIAVLQFIAQLISYPWVWKPRKFTLGRLTLMALVVSGVSAVILLISSGLANR
jgi:heme/copper-type cytochrome/quinol oxidase subunit 4